jgi:ribosomal protein L17
MTWQAWQLNIVTSTSECFSNSAHRRRVSSETMDTKRTDALISHVAPRFGASNDGGFINM